MANEQQGNDLRQARHDARANQTWSQFIDDLCSLTNLDDESATQAARSVLVHLEERLTEEEAEDLEAQLPVRLREMLQAATIDREKVHKLHKGDFVACVAADLGIPPADSEVIIRAVFATVRDLISEGEASDVHAQLPKDLKPLWLQPI